MAGLASLLVAMLAAGCSKHGANDEAPPAPKGSAPMNPPPAAVVIPNTGDVTANLNQLSLELRKYVVRTRSVPKDFDDFIAKAHVQAPPPPAGKKYAIEHQAVVLVKR